MATVLGNARAKEVVEELCRKIKESFPEAEFRVAEGGDLEGVYIYAYANIDTVWDMLPLVSDRVTDILMSEEIPIYVVPMRIGQ